MDVLSNILLRLQSWHIFMSIVVILCAVYLRDFYGYICNKVELHAAYKKVGGIKGHWLWGHVFTITPDEKGILKRWETIKQFPKMQVLRAGPLISSTVISMYFPSVLQDLLTADRPKEYWTKLFFKPWIGDGLLLSHGKKWQRNRKLLTPAFHFEILKNYVQVFNESVDIMESKLHQSEDAIDVFEPVSLMTLDSMLRCMMSYESDCQVVGQSHPYVKAVTDLTNGVVQCFYLQPFSRSPFLFSLTKPGRKFYAAVKIANEQTTTVIKSRIKSLENEKSSETKNKRYLDFLDILLLAKDANGNGLQENEIRDEVDTFLFEGHDTTASGISWILYDLATHPEHQKKCREEVNGVLGERDYVEWEDLPKFKYLTMFIKESMRVHPPVPILSRSFAKPYTFEKDFGKDQLNTSANGNTNCSQTVPKNTNAEVNIISLHHNPNVWKDPEVFDPLRFKPENFAKQPHFSYIPFSAGPRNCIGQNFAMMEIKITLAKCLKHFEFYVDETCPKPSMMPLLVLKSQTGINIRFKSL